MHARAGARESSIPPLVRPGVSRREERRKTGTPKPVYYSKRRLVLPRDSRAKKEAWAERNAALQDFLAGFIRGQPSAADNAADRFCRPQVPSTLLFP